MEEASAFAAEQPPWVEGVDSCSRETLDHLEDVLDLAAELPDEDEGNPVGEALDGNLYAELHQGLPAHGAPHFFSDDLLDVGVVHVYLISQRQSRRELRELRACSSAAARSQLVRTTCGSAPARLMASARPPRLAASPAPLIPSAGGDRCRSCCAL